MLRFTRLVLLIGLLGWGTPLPAHAQTAVPPAVETPAASSASYTLDTAPRDAALYYIAGDEATLYRFPNSQTSLATLAVRTPVHRHYCNDGWCQIETESGRVGYVARRAISNVWIRVSKRGHRVELYRGAARLHTFKADFGYNAFLDKVRQGSTSRRDHWRTPEGLFYIVRKNPNSAFDKALVLNYPTAADARRGFAQGLISRTTRNAIVQANAQRRMPPMNTPLGGWIELHGDGTGAGVNWTQGCIALHNRDMQTLWWWTQVGTPVLIE